MENQLVKSVFLSNNKLSQSPQTTFLLWWDILEIDLAATPMNTKCPMFLTRILYPEAEGIDCLYHPCKFSLGYIFPPIPIIARFFTRLRRSSNTVIAVIPFWPRTMLLQLSEEAPIPLVVTPDLLSQGQFLHPAPEKLHLEAKRFLENGFLLVAQQWSWDLESPEVA